MVKVKISDWKADSSMDEAYKALRTNIQFCGADKKVIAFTSCTPNEGKSNVTFHLAASLAESGKSVLLIDADLRKSVPVQAGETAGRYLRNQSSQVSHYFFRCCTAEPGRAFRKQTV